MERAYLAAHESSLMIFRSFTQLVYDAHFSTLGLTLVAELSGIQCLVAPCKDQAEDHTSLAAEYVGSRDTFLLNLSEEVGDSIERCTMSDSTEVGTHSVLAFKTVTRPGCDWGAEKRLYRREGHGGPNCSHPNAGATVASLESSAPVEKQKQRSSVNIIDQLFHELD